MSGQNISQEILAYSRTSGELLMFHDKMRLFFILQ